MIQQSIYSSQQSTPQSNINSYSSNTSLINNHGFIDHVPIQLPSHQINSKTSFQSNKSCWTYQQQQKLFRLHNQLGNKWSLIAEHFPSMQMCINKRQRTDNNVKNHFYSRLRKSLRKINKIISNQYKKQIKQIKQNIIYKIIQFTELQHKKHQISSKLSQTQQNYNQKNLDQIQISIKLKNRLLQYSYDQVQNAQNNQIGKQLIRDLINFTKNIINKTKGSHKLTKQSQQPKSISKRQLVRQSKLFGPIQIGNSQYDIFQTASNSPTQNKVKTRKRTKSIQKSKSKITEKITIDQSYSRNSTPTMVSGNMGFKQRAQSFLKDSGFLDCFFLPILPELMKKESQYFENPQRENIEVEQQMEQPKIFEQIYDQGQKSSLIDHFNDPQLDQGKFSIFE